MTLKQQSPKATADLRVQGFENRPATVTKVTEPTTQNAGQFGRDQLDRTGPPAGRQFFDPRLHLRKALATRIDLFPAKRVTQKREALNTTINDLRLRRMPRPAHTKLLWYQGLASGSHRSSRTFGVSWRYFLCLDAA